jgi:hypothetical protein
MVELLMVEPLILEHFMVELLILDHLMWELLMDQNIIIVAPLRSTL